MKEHDRHHDFLPDPVILPGPRDLGPLGATPVPEGTLFRVWAPLAGSVDLLIDRPGERPRPMSPDVHGYHSLTASDAPPGTLYRFRLDGQATFPDPASRLQPHGVHGPSAVWFPPSGGKMPDDFPRVPSFSGHALEDLIFYELHTGTYTPEGTFSGVLRRLDHLVALGITAIELMPLSQFPGERNWGYDGTFPYALQFSYGGPDGLLELVHACHVRGLSVILDVVYNHLGPEGNYLGAFGPYFSRTTRTPWGDAINFDEAQSDHVRHFFLENLRYLARTFDVDGFRFDAVHAIRDQSAHSFLADMSVLAGRIGKSRGRPLHMVAESNLNDRRHVLSPEREGMGFASQWCDDFHHALRVTFSGERDGYYRDFSGGKDMARALERGFVYQGQFAPSFGHRRGSSGADLPGSAFVVFAQNHDQIGNRREGDRLSLVLPEEALMCVAALVVLAPALPLLFMGEEYGETKPFLYFTSHGDPDLVRAVREGRKREFSSFGWTGEVPDPQDPRTFESSRLVTDPSGLSPGGREGRILRFYKNLIQLRKAHPAFGLPPRMDDGGHKATGPRYGVLAQQRHGNDGTRILVLWNLTDRERPVPPVWLRREFDWKEEGRSLLDSREGSPARPHFLAPYQVRVLEGPEGKGVL